MIKYPLIEEKGGMDSCKLYKKSLGEYETNGYLLVFGDKAFAVDAPPGAADFYNKHLDGIKLEALLLTHSHFDHIADARKIQEMGVKVGIHLMDAGNCERPGSDKLPLMMDVLPFKPDFLLQEGTFDIKPASIEVIHTPGHTPGGVCFIVGTRLFSGDTLFKHSIGNLNFPTGNKALMKQSLQKLAHLRANYTIYPGHGPLTTLDEERPFILQILKAIG